MTPRLTLTNATTKELYSISGDGATTYERVSAFADEQVVIGVRTQIWRNLSHLGFESVYLGCGVLVEDDMLEYSERV